MIKRDNFFDVIKGVGIISVVIGHCINPTQKFIYIYHLFLFFFVSGYFFNKNKNLKDPINNFFHKFKNNYFKFLFYCFLFILMHNIFLQLGIINDIWYGKTQIINNIYKSSLFFITESLGGALWFIPVMLYGIASFCILHYISFKINNNKISIFFLIFSCFIFGFFGLILAYKNIDLINHLQISLIIIPVILLGYLFKNYNLANKTFKEFLNIPGFFISLGIIILIMKIFPNKMIDLRFNKIYDIRFFYIIVFLGLYMSLSFSKILCKFKMISSHIGFIGKNSYEIMGLHFMFLKLIDYFIYTFDKNIILDTFPISDKRFYIIYVIIGIYGPISFKFLYNRIISFIIYKIKLINIKINKLNI